MHRDDPLLHVYTSTQDKLDALIQQYNREVQKVGFPSVIILCVILGKTPITTYIHLHTYAQYIHIKINLFL